MAQIINTNVASLLAQRNLAKTSDAMTTSIQRLSSGLRINSSRDDAAGLAIATMMTSQIMGLKQAARNSNDAISLAQIAEGAMGTTTDLLQRMRELSVQAANGTNSSSDRQALQDDVKQLIAQMDDIANNTQFNGQSILNGAFSNTVFQVGANANETTSFSINSIASDSVGYLAQQTGTNVSTNAATDITISIGGTNGTTNIGNSANFAGSLVGQEGDSAYAKARALKAANVGGLSVQASTAGSASAITGGVVGGAAGDLYSLKVNGTTIFNNQDVSAGLSAKSLVDGINGQSNHTGVVASLDSTGTIVSLAAADGRTIKLDESTSAGAAANVLTTGDFDNAGAQTADLSGQLKISASNIIYLGGTLADLGLSAATIMTDTVGINTLDISTQDGAENAIQRIDSALSSIAANRAAMGAMENRFEETIANLGNIADNTSAARSRIQDADYAEEMAGLTKSQILQQAGTAMLAQANNMPQSVLSLLG